MTYTFLSASFTNTYLAPCSLTHLVVHSPALAFAPLAPHWLSEIQPVKLPSAATVMAAANSVAAMVTILSFIVTPSKTTLPLDSAQGQALAWHSLNGMSRTRSCERPNKQRIRIRINKKRRILWNPPLDSSILAQLLLARTGVRISCSGCPSLWHAQIA